MLRSSYNGHGKCFISNIRDPYISFRFNDFIINYYNIQKVACIHTSRKTNNCFRQLYSYSFGRILVVIGIII